MAAGGAGGETERREARKRGRSSFQAPRHRLRPRCLSRSAGPGLGGAGRERTSASAAMAADGTPRRPVLSVSARKIKDNAADWHNLMMKWERLNDNGFTTANKIVNMKIGEQFQDNKLEITCDNTTTESEKPSPKYNEELDNCCAELLETLKKMTKIQLKMEKLSSTTKGICDLETFHHGAGNRTAPLFHTWPTVYFYEVSLKLSEMYKKELQLKQTIVQEIAHSADQDLMMVYLSSWLYQPYLDNSSKLLLEAMLLETGHRQC
ncbi:cyclin-dependent kinase 2-interacting protein isoform X1 [Numida meleagris]|uniref:cyclin-dependent kinase 2-interacting protein isoform X1 n=1 Tax=Numida meleagris TaxID=8996 RepID=UPI000B3D96BB|nr:cyclin-dependent kinase 2-interacting protein isoform X1 [Numida meleagris]